MNGYIDLHAHILPNVDHGSTDMATSLNQLSLAEQAGVGIIAATPHFYPDSHSANSFIKRRTRSFAALTEAYHGNITILLGAEVFLCPGLQNHPALTELCISNSNTLLTEMPPPPWPKRYEETLLALREERGLNIILAHIECYSVQDVDRLLSLGFHGQINATALRKPLQRRRLKKLIATGQITALGSDIHGLSDAYTDYAWVARHMVDQTATLQTSMERYLCN